MKRSGRNEDYSSFKRQRSDGIPLFIRNFVHIDGNWPSHLYLIGNYSRLFRLSEICLKHYCATYQQRGVAQPFDCKLHGPDYLSAIAQPHLSLSRPFVLRLHQIQPFLEALQEKLQHIQRFTASVSSNYRLLLNEQRTRLFVAHPISKTGSSITTRLQILVSHIDEVLRSYQQQPYYSEPFYHISIASAVVPSACDGCNSICIASKEAILDADNAKIHIVTKDQCSLLHQQVSDFYDFSKKKSADSDDSSDDDEYGQWSSQIPYSIADQEDAVTTMATHMQSYGSDDDEVQKSPADQCSAATSAGVDSPKLPALTQVLEFTGIECTVGNRTFQFMFVNDNNISKTSCPSYRKFIEVNLIPRITKMN